MYRNITSILSALAILGFMSVGAHAATVSIVAPAAVTEGDTFDIQLVGNFDSDGLIAGALRVNYDPALIAINDVTLNLAVDPDFSCPGAATCPPDPGGVLPIAWGEFLSDLIPPGAGDTLMATVSVTALAPSPGTGLIPFDFPELTGGWFGAGFVSISTPEFFGAAVVINPVPLPAAAWLFGSALLGLGVIKRKRV